MDHTIEAVKGAVRAVLSAKGAKLYVGQRSEPDGTVAPKHGFLWTTTESPRAPTYGRQEDVVTLQLFAPNLYELGELEDAVEFLDDHRPPDYGNARSQRWEAVSKTRLQEGEGKWQMSILYSVAYSDARKWRE